MTVPNPADDKTHITLDPSKLETLIKLIQRIPCHDHVELGEVRSVATPRHTQSWCPIPHAELISTVQPTLATTNLRIGAHPCVGIGKLLAEFLSDLPRVFVDHDGAGAFPGSITAIIWIP